MIWHKLPDGEFETECGRCVVRKFVEARDPSKWRQREFVWEFVVDGAVSGYRDSIKEAKRVAEVTAIDNDNFWKSVSQDIEYELNQGE